MERLTIDEVIEKEKEMSEPCSTLCANECDCTGCRKGHKQLAEMLEELKAYREIGTVEKCRNSVLDIERAYNKGYADGSLSVTSEIRNKVIDECLAVLYKNAGKIISIRFYEQIFDEMKQLKAGGENGC